MPATNAEAVRAEILAACRAFVLEDVPLPAAEASLTGGTGRPRSAMARNPVVAWLPISLSQNRIAAIVGRGKESSIFGPKRLWRSKAAFDDALRLVLVEAAFHDGDGDVFRVPQLNDLSQASVAERQEVLTEFVRTSTESFIKRLSESRTFLVGMSARAGVAATPAEIGNVRKGRPSSLWKAVIARIASSRDHYHSVYEDIATCFGLACRSGARPEVTFGAFVAIARAAAEGFGQAAAFDPNYFSPCLEVNGTSWTYFGWLIGTLLNKLFTLDGELPIPSLDAAVLVGRIDRP